MRISDWSSDVCSSDLVTFKVSPVAYEMLRDQPGLRPAPYLASRGMKWIQQHDRPGLSAPAPTDHLHESPRLFVSGLPPTLSRDTGAERLGLPPRCTDAAGCQDALPDYFDQHLATQ